MENLARDFARLNNRRFIENLTEKEFTTLKDIALLLFDQVVTMQKISENLMKEKLIGTYSSQEIEE